MLELFQVVAAANHARVHERGGTFHFGGTSSTSPHFENSLDKAGTRGTRPYDQVGCSHFYHARTLAKVSHVVNARNAGAVNPCMTCVESGPVLKAKASTPSRAVRI